MKGFLYTLIAALMLLGVTQLNAQEMTEGRARALVDMSHVGPNVRIAAGTYIVKGPDGSYGVCFILAGPERSGNCQGFKDLAEQLAELQAAERLVTELDSVEQSF